MRMLTWRQLKHKAIREWTDRRLSLCKKTESETLILGLLSNLLVFTEDEETFEKFLPKL